MILQPQYMAIDTSIGLIPGQANAGGKSEGVDFSALLGLLMHGDTSAAEGIEKAPEVVIRFSDDADTDSPLFAHGAESLSSGDAARSFEAQLVIRTPDGGEVSLPVVVSFTGNGNDISVFPGTGVESGDAIVITMKEIYSTSVTQLLESMTQTRQPVPFIPDEQASPEQGTLTDVAFSAGRVVTVLPKVSGKSSETVNGRTITGAADVQVPDEAIENTHGKGNESLLPDELMAAIPAIIPFSGGEAGRTQDSTALMSIEPIINDISETERGENAGNGMTARQDGTPNREVTIKNLGKNIQSIKDTPQTTLSSISFNSVPQPTKNQPAILFHTVSGTTPFTVNTGEATPSESRFIALIDALVSSGAQVEIVLETRRGGNESLPAVSDTSGDVPAVLKSAMVYGENTEAAGKGVTVNPASREAGVDVTTEAEKFLFSDGIYGGRIRHITTQKTVVSGQAGEEPIAGSVNNSRYQPETRLTGNNTGSDTLPTLPADNGENPVDNHTFRIMRQSGGPGTVTSSTSEKNTPINNPSKPPDAVFIIQEQELATNPHVQNRQSDGGTARPHNPITDSKSNGNTPVKQVSETPSGNVHEAGRSTEMLFTVNETGTGKMADTTDENGSTVQHTQPDLPKTDAGKKNESATGRKVEANFKMEKNPDIVLKREISDNEQIDTIRLSNNQSTGKHTETERTVDTGKCSAGPERIPFSRNPVDFTTEFQTTEATPESMTGMISDKEQSSSSILAVHGSVTSKDSGLPAESAQTEGVRVSSVTDGTPESMAGMISDKKQSSSSSPAVYGSVTSKDSGLPAERAQTEGVRVVLATEDTPESMAGMISDKEQSSSSSPAVSDPVNAKNLASSGESIQIEGVRVVPEIDSAPGSMKGAMNGKVQSSPDNPVVFGSAASKVIGLTAENAQTERARGAQGQPVSDNKPVSDHQADSFFPHESGSGKTVTGKTALTRQDTTSTSQGIGQSSIAVSDETSAVTGSNYFRMTEGDAGKAGEDSGVRDVPEMNGTSKAVSGNTSRNHNPIQQAVLPDGGDAIPGGTDNSDTVQSGASSADSVGDRIHSRHSTRTNHSGRDAGAEFDINRPFIHEDSTRTTAAVSTGKETGAPDKAAKAATPIPEPDQAIVPPVEKHAHKVSKEEQVSSESLSGKTMPVSGKTVPASGGSGGQFAQDSYGQSRNGRGMYFEAPRSADVNTRSKNDNIQDGTDIPEETVAAYTRFDTIGDRPVSMNHGVGSNPESRFSQFLPEMEFEVLNSIVRQARFMIGNGKSSADIQLDPPALGRLKLEIITENSKVTGKITVESREVKDIVQNSIAELKEQLSQSGLKVQSFDVQVGHNSGTDSWANRERIKNFSQSNRRDVFNAQSKSSVEKIAGEPVRRAGISQSEYIDLWI